MSYTEKRRRKISKLINFSLEEWLQVTKHYAQSSPNKHYQNITEYIRETAVNGHAIQVLTLINTEQYLRQINAIGRNINQIAIMAHITHSVSNEQIEAIHDEFLELRGIFQEWNKRWNTARYVYGKPDSKQFDRNENNEAYIELSEQETTPQTIKAASPYDSAATALLSHQVANNDCKQ